MLWRYQINLDLRCNMAENYWDDDTNTNDAYDYEAEERKREEEERKRKEEEEERQKKKEEEERYRRRLEEMEEKRKREEERRKEIGPDVADVYKTETEKKAAGYVEIPEKLIGESEYESKLREHGKEIEEYKKRGEEYKDELRGLIEKEKADEEERQQEFLAKGIVPEEGKEHQRVMKEYKRLMFEQVAKERKAEEDYQKALNVEEERQKEKEKGIKKVFHEKPWLKRPKTPHEADQLIDAIAGSQDRAEVAKLVPRALDPKIEEKGIDRREKIKEEKLKEAIKDFSETKKEAIEKEVMPYYNAVTKVAEAAERDNPNLARIAKLTEEGTAQGAIPGMGAWISQGIYGMFGINMDSILTTDQQELNKLSIDFMRNVKAALGTSQLTAREVDMYMKTVPNLTQSPEGRLRVIQNSILTNALKILKKNGMDKILRENNYVVPENLSDQVDKLIKDKSETISTLLTDGIRKANEGAPLRTIKLDEVRNLTEFEPTKKEKAEGLPIEETIERQISQNRLSIPDINKSIKTPEDLEEFVRSIKSLPGLDKQGNRDRVAQFLMQKRFRYMDRKRIKEKNDEIERELGIAEKKRGKLREIEERPKEAFNKIRDKIRERTNITDDKELNRLAAGMMQKKVTQMKKDIDTAVERSMGLKKELRKGRFTKEQFKEETKKLATQLQKVRGEFLKEEKEERETLRKERKFELEKEKKQFAREQKRKKENIPYYDALRKTGEGADEEDLLLKRMLVISETGNLSSRWLARMAETAEKDLKPLLAGAAGLAIAGPAGAVVAPIIGGKMVKGKVKLDITRTLTPETQEMIKLTTTFMRNVKKVLQTSRITQTEIDQYMRGVPGIMMTREGRRRVITQKLKLNEVLRLRKKTADEVIKEAGGIGKISKIELADKVRQKVKTKERKLIDELINLLKPSKFVKETVKKGKKIRAERRKKEKARLKKLDMPETPGFARKIAGYD